MLAMSIREERQVAEGLTPAIAWPTLRLALLLPLAQAGLIAGALTGLVPLWLVILPLGYIVFAYYTLVHEGIHGNIARRPDLAWVHQWIGWWGALNMMTSYPALRRIHLLHHQHTNTDADPDYNLCHGPLWKSVGRVLFLRTLLLLPLPIVRLVPAASYTIKQAMLTPQEMKVHAITVTSLQLLFWIGVATGYWQVALLLYWVPVMIGLVLLNIFFQWLPHVPFDKTDRYGKARVYWPVGYRILLGQNLHLGHHLWPSVPFYNYRRLNDRLRPQLESAGARLQGFLPPSSVPLVSPTTEPAL
jgi:beta-carotene hydroxylase